MMEHGMVIQIGIPASPLVAVAVGKKTSFLAWSSTRPRLRPCLHYTTMAIVMIRRIMRNEKRNYDVREMISSPTYHIICRDHRRLRKTDLYHSSSSSTSKIMTRR